VIAEDGVGVVGRQLRAVERSAHLRAHVHKRSIVRRKERVLAGGTCPVQPTPRRSVFHVILYLQQLQLLQQR